MRKWREVGNSHRLFPFSGDLFWMVKGGFVKLFLSLFKLQIDELGLHAVLKI